MAQFLLPKARNTVTGQTVKTQDLAGARFAPNQRSQAQLVADDLANKMSRYSGDAWVGFLEIYTPTQRR